MSPTVPVTFLLLLGYAVAIGLTASLAAYCFVQRSHDVGNTFGLCMLALLVWSLGAFGRLLAPTEAIWHTWSVVMYVGVSTAAVLFFVFTLLYTGARHHLTRRRIGALFALPAASLLLLATNGFHGLFFAEVATVPFGGEEVYTTAAGPWFWVNALYSYVLFGLATGILTAFAVRNHRIYRRQTLALIGGATVPWLANVAYLFLLGPNVPVDPTPVGFAVGSCLLAYAVFGAGLADLTPIARSAVVDAIDEAVLVVDREGRLVDRNPVAESLLTVDDAVGRPVADVVPAALLAEDDDPVAVEVDGTERWFRSRELPLADDGAVLLVTDLSEQVRRQRQLHEQNRRLEEFTRVAAHDLRNPLNTISGYVDLARETGDVSHLEEVDSATDRVETLIDDLLTLGRQGRVAEPSDTSPVSLGVAAEVAWADVTTDGDLAVLDDGYVVATEHRFVRLLEHLFTNAVTYGGEDVTVTVGTLPDGFFVADDGTGIETENRAEVFRYGYSTHGGTGLGLPVVRSIAVAHGWEVDVVEADGGGARFEFTGVGIRSSEALDAATVGNSGGAGT